MRALRGRVALLIALILGSSPFFVSSLAAPPPAMKTEYFKGKVVPLAGILAKFGSKL